MLMTCVKLTPCYLTLGYEYLINFFNSCRSYVDLHSVVRPVTPSGLHGRAHTAGHCDNPLNSERFAGRGYVPQAFTHGTLQCDDVERSRRFYFEVLGLESPPVSTPPITSNIQRRRGISSSCNAARQYLSPVNRFTLQRGSAAEVEQAHREFVSQKNSLGPNEITDIDHADGTVNFIFSDPDKN
jgi:hypothetical protein